MPASPRSNLRLRASHLAAGFGLVACFAPLVAGCSEAPPLVPRGAWYVAFVDIPGCGPGAENAEVGIVRADNRNELKEDGLDGAEISCSVKEGGSGFTVSALAAAKSKSLVISVEGLSSAATEANPVKGTISFTTPQTATAFTSDQCDFYFLDTGQGVKAGEVWLTFKCEKLSASPDNACAINIGYAAFEKCRSEDEDE
jgi:hypothetical protein